MPPIQPPVHGGPVYWYIRNSIAHSHGRLSRYWRYWQYNHDFARAQMSGIPKMSYNPRVNIWTDHVDYHMWRGAGSKLNDLYIWGRFWLSCAAVVYFAHHRLLASGKYDVFKSS
eukprot:GHVQ01017575.1.p1 GENE.GHVQ01017575.1~~GHVQ01017575.1.p1  ORF type:complete len:114 (+),score=3.88 GHVQ01017575.1:170-511(+)